MTKIQEYINSLVNQIEIAKKVGEEKGIYLYFDELLEVDYSGEIPSYFPDFYEKYVANKIIKYLQSYGYVASNYESWLKKISPKVINGWKIVDEKMANMGRIAFINESEIAAELSDNNSSADKIIGELLEITNDPNLINSMKRQYENIDVSNLENKLKVVYHVLENFILKRQIDSFNIDDLREKVLGIMNRESTTIIESLKMRINYPDFPSFMLPVFQSQIEGELQKIEEAKLLVDKMDLNALREYLYETNKVDHKFLAFLASNKGDSQDIFDNELQYLEEMKSILETIETLKYINSLPEFKELVTIFLDRQSSMNKLTQLRKKQVLDDLIDNKKKRKKNELQEDESNTDNSFEKYVPIFSKKSELFTQKALELFKSIIDFAKITDDEKNNLLRIFNDSFSWFTRVKTSKEFVEIFNQRISLIIENLFNLYVKRFQKAYSNHSNPALDTPNDIEQRILALKSQKEQLLSKDNISGNFIDIGISPENLKIYQEIFNILKEDQDTLELFDEDLSLVLKKENI